MKITLKEFAEALKTGRIAVVMIKGIETEFGREEFKFKEDIDVFDLVNDKTVLSSAQINSITSENDKFKVFIECIF